MSKAGCGRHSCFSASWVRWGLGFMVLLEAAMAWGRAVIPPEDYCASLLLPPPAPPSEMPDRNRRLIEAAIAGFQKSLGRENDESRLQNALREIWWRRLGGVHATAAGQAAHFSLVIFRPEGEVEYVRFEGVHDPTTTSYTSSGRSLQYAIFRFVASRLDFPQMVGKKVTLPLQEIPRLYTSLLQGTIVNSPMLEKSFALVLPPADLGQVSDKIPLLQTQVQQLLGPANGRLFKMQDQLLPGSYNWDQSYHLAISQVDNPNRNVIWDIGPAKTWIKGKKYNLYHASKRFYDAQLYPAEDPAKSRIEAHYYFVDALELAFWLGNDLANTLPKIAGPKQDIASEVQQLFAAYQQQVGVISPVQLDWAEIFDENRLTQQGPTHFNP